MTRRSGQWRDDAGVGSCTGHGNRVISKSASVGVGWQSDPGSDGFSIVLVERTDRRRGTLQRERRGQVSQPKAYICSRIRVLCVYLSSHTCLVGCTVHLAGWLLSLAWVTGYMDVVSVVIGVSHVSVHSYSRRSLSALYVDNTSVHSIVIFIHACYSRLSRQGLILPITRQY